MDSSTCRERLARLIAQETDGLADLAALLEREHEQLSSQDTAALTAALGERKARLLRIVHAGEERRALLTSLGHSTDPAGLGRLIRSCDRDGELARAWQHCTQVAARCRLLNDRNGALVSARLQHGQARLGTLLSARREPVTYGRRGGYALPSVGRVVKTEA
jgi:flagellar biosynthesis protein FlgN